MEDLAADNPVSATVDNPNGTQPDTNGTGATSGQAQEATPTVDLFKGVDPNRLPPDARAAYDSMLRDYREKTGKLSETIKAESAKAAEAYRSKAELYDQIANQEEFVRQWNEYVQKSQSNGQPQQTGNPAISQLEAQIQEIKKTQMMADLAQVTEAFAEAQDEKGVKLHPEFDQLNSISMGQIQNGQEAEDFSLLRACVELAKGMNPQEKLANGYKTAKAIRDQIFEEGKKAGMGRLQAKVMNGTNPPSNSHGDTLSLTEKKPKNAREALEMARKGQMVSRD